MQVKRSKCGALTTCQRGWWNRHLSYQCQNLPTFGRCFFRPWCSLSCVKEVLTIIVCGLLSSTCACTTSSMWEVISFMSSRGRTLNATMDLWFYRRQEVTHKHPQSVHQTQRDTQDWMCNAHFQLTWMHLHRSVKAPQRMQDHPTQWIALKKWSETF